MLTNSFKHLALVLSFLLLTLPTFAQKNLIKWAPLKLTPLPAPSALQFGYERVVGAKATLYFGTKIFFSKDMTNEDGSFTRDNGEVPSGIFNSGSFRGFTITTEYRYYTNKSLGAPKGFYLSPFIRYLNYNLDGVFDYSPDNGEENSLIDGKTNVSGIGGGFGLGAQKVWKSGFLFDWNVGVGVAVMSGSMIGTVVGPINDDIPGFVQDLSEALSTIPLVNTELTNEGDDLNARGSGLPWPILKTQVAIGYAF